MSMLHKAALCYTLVVSHRADVHTTQGCLMLHIGGVTRRSSRFHFPSTLSGTLCKSPHFRKPAGHHSFTSTLACAHHLDMCRRAAQSPSLYPVGSWSSFLTLTLTRSGMLRSPPHCHQPVGQQVVCCC
eukprot:1161224-Pelagomonas_calceolata.AAC.13